MPPTTAPPHRRSWACVALVALLVSCGSTVQRTGPIAQPDVGGTDSPGVASLEQDDGLGESGAMPTEPSRPDEAGRDVAAGPPDGASGTESATTGSGGGGSASPPGGAVNEGARPPGPETGRGFTRDEISIGFATAKSAGDAMAAFGIALATGNQEAQLRAIVNDINERGGILGRRVVPVVYDFDPSSLQNPGPAAEAACAHWTQDNQVFAVVNVWALGSGDDTLNSCLANRQTPLISMSPQLRPEASYSRFHPYLVAPANVAMERFVPAWLERAAANGYFDGWNTSTGAPGNAPTVAGILVNQSLYGSDLDRIVRETLVQRGVTVGPTFEYSGSLTSNSSEMNSAVIRFKAQGVTHVITSEGMEPFAQAAESQGYWPRYVMSSFHNPAFAQTLVPRQLRGAVGAGLIPALDVDTARDPGVVSEADSRCRQIMEAEGEDTSSRQALSLMLTACDGFNFLALAAQAGGLSAEGLADGARALNSMPAASTFAISFSGTRLTGASALRDFRFGQDCSCFAYTTSTNHPM